MHRFEPAFKGIFPPMLTPVHNDGAFDDAAMRDFVDWLIARGVHGLFPNGSTGEFTRFDLSTQKEIVKTVAGATEGRVPIFAGATQRSTRLTIETCHEYHDMGVSAAIIVSPIYFQTSQEGLRAYFGCIAEASPLPIFLYNIPSLATEIQVATVIDLAKAHPNIIGIKDSSGNVPNMMRMMAGLIDHRPDFAFFTGYDSLIASMLSLGVAGGMVASANVIPEVMRKIFDTCVDGGDPRDALTLQHRVSPLFDEMLSAPEFPEGFRMGLRSRDFDPGPALMPLTNQQGRDNALAAESIQRKVLGFETLFS
ncbi:MAG: dihydrodipicolinate synthase family protein [Planctomycetota bacterium]